MPMLIGTLGTSLLTGTRLFRAGSGNNCNRNQGKVLFRAGRGMFRAGHGLKKLLIPLHHLTNVK